MLEIMPVGLVLAKPVFQAHGAGVSGRAVLCKKLRRDQVLAFFAQLPPCVVAMEACGGAHFWGRELAKLGHDMRLIPPAYVKAFVERQKSDMAGAEAICEVSSRLRSDPTVQWIVGRGRRQRPTMRFVAVMSEESQAAAVIVRTRDLLVRQRTQLIDAARAGPQASSGSWCRKGLLG